VDAPDMASEPPDAPARANADTDVGAIVMTIIRP